MLRHRVGVLGLGAARILKPSSQHPNIEACLMDLIAGCVILYVYHNCLKRFVLLFRPPMFVYIIVNSHIVMPNSWTITSLNLNLQTKIPKTWGLNL